MLVSRALAWLKIHCSKAPGMVFSGIPKATTHSLSLSLSLATGACRSTTFIPAIHNYYCSPGAAMACTCSTWIRTTASTAWCRFATPRFSTTTTACTHTFNMLHAWCSTIITRLTTRSASTPTVSSKQGPGTGSKLRESGGQNENWKEGSRRIHGCNEWNI